MSDSLAVSSMPDAGETVGTYTERVGNLHIHTLASDGTGSPEEVATAAAQAGLDYVIITDHNTYSPERQGWHGSVLLLVGEEINDPARPHVNHLLVLNASADLSGLGGRTQALLDEVSQRGGLSFIAHPVEISGAMSGEPEIPWVAWDARGYTGFEIWNYMSEFKSHVRDPLRAVQFALAPRLAISGPFREALGRWDAALALGPCWIVGGSDAHARVYRLGPIVRRVFPYLHLFRQVNTHILVRGAWTSDVDKDASLVYEALASGRAFVGYDGLAPTRGFRFGATDAVGWHSMGETAEPGERTRIVVESPRRARLRLLRDGSVVAAVTGRRMDYVGPAAGVYRVEALRRYAGRWRYWIISNPILVRHQDAP